MTPFLEILIDRVKHEYSLRPPSYSDCSMHAKELETIRRECSEQSSIDTANMRSYIFNRTFVNGDAPILCRQSVHGRIIVALESTEQVADIPWDTWFRILRLFSNGKQITAVILARTLKRTAPPRGEPIRPVNINGGYTYPCRPDFICVYRAEDATRVLIHELFHAMCSDNLMEGIDWMEAKTEAWAEVIYSVVLAKGARDASERALKRQAQWIAVQNNGIRSRHMRTDKSSEFPWRYTIGKELVFHRITHLPRPIVTAREWNGSLRLTQSPTATQKREHGVATSSTML